MRREHLQLRFVEFIPDHLEEGELYISMEYRTVVHLCCCGCGRKVVTPLGPTDWSLTFDGKSMSLEPSIGSWNLPCKSHYWIRNNQVLWAATWTTGQVQAGREREAALKRAYFEDGQIAPKPPPAPASAPVVEPRQGLWDRLRRLFDGPKSG